VRSEVFQLFRNVDGILPYSPPGRIKPKRAEGFRVGPRLTEGSPLTSDSPRRGCGDQAIALSRRTQGVTIELTDRLNNSLLFVDSQLGIDGQIQHFDTGRFGLWQPFSINR
jgi:hypothetical protein